MPDLLLLVALTGALGLCWMTIEALWLMRRAQARAQEALELGQEAVRIEVARERRRCLAWVQGDRDPRRASHWVNLADLEQEIRSGRWPEAHRGD